MPEGVTRATKGPKRPGRPRRGQSSLTRSTILVAALELVDEDGIEALSMRRLATRLSVDPMSIYHHIPNKAALVSGLVDIVFSQMASPTGDTWQDRIRAWAAAYRDVALAHPNLVLQIVTDSAAASEAAVMISEPLYEAFASAGLNAREVVNASGTLVDFVNGYALAMAPSAARRTTGGDPMGERLAAKARQGQEPKAKDARSTETSTGFHAGIDIIIRGVAPTIA